MHHTSKDARRRLARAAIGAGGAAALAVTTLVNVPAASAVDPVTPSFPDNIVVFPNRDFVSVEGYDAPEYKDLPAVVEVIRPSAGDQVMGRAVAPISGTDVAFEINHPGGFCWGAGPDNANFQVTPDIKAGDIVRVTLPDGRVEQTVTSSATVTQDMALSGTELTVVGSVGTDVDKAQMEQRIINPALVDTDVAKRDIRAVPGGFVRAPKGGYESNLEFLDDSTFRATYRFDRAATAEIAAAADLGERAMSWQVEDAEANRQGLTIAEFGEAGGPGMGGCPAGPEGQDAPAGTAGVIRRPGATTADLTWSPVAPQPGADAVTGYDVEAISTTPNANGEVATVGARTGAEATSTTITGLQATQEYTYEVRSRAGDVLGAPFDMGGTTPPPNDTTPPTLSLDPPGGADPASAVEANSVTVATNGQAYYTTDGSSPITAGDSPADGATILPTSKVIPIPTGPNPTEVKVASFDRAGNHTETGGFYKRVSVNAPAVPSGLAAGTPQQDRVALSWTEVTGATSYLVRVYAANGTTVGDPLPTNIASKTVTGLTPGTTYRFSVSALNAGGESAESAQLEVRTPAASDRVTISRAQWKARDFRVEGTGSQIGAFITLFKVVNGTETAISAPVTTVTAPVAPATVGDWVVRLRNGDAPADNPGTIVAKSSGGGTTLPFPVANK